METKSPLEHSPREIYSRSRRAQMLWGSLPVAARLRSLRRLRKELASQSDLFVKAISHDIGKPELDALSGDVLTTLEILRYYEKNADRILRRRRVESSGAVFWGNRFYESFTPYGSVLVISPWNYPLQLSLVPLITALIAGNSVVLKPSEHAPQTNRAIRSLFENIGFPKDLVLICEGDHRTGAALIDEKPDFVFFTGSMTAGKSIAQKCSASLIPNILELGGKDPMIVCEDAHLERAAKGATYGAFLNAGQVCVGVKKLYVQESVYPSFLKLLKEEIKQLRVGQPQSSDMGRVVLTQHLNELAASINEAIQQGAKPETDFKMDGNYLHPLLLSHVPESSKLHQDEVFAPVVILETFKNEDEVIGRINSSQYGLSSSVWSRNMDRAQGIAQKLITGSTAINQVVVQIANPASHFGGEKHSGLGRYHGPEGLRSLSRRKTVMTNKGSRRSEINWFPYQEKTKKLLKLFIRYRHGLWISALYFSLSSFAATGTLVAHVFKIPNQSGTLRYLLFNSKDGFPNDKEKSLLGGPASIGPDGTATIRFEKLPYGEYALSVYHDENNNLKLDTGFFGIPKESVGASNDPKGRMGPPRYDDAKFNFNQEIQELTIHMVIP